MSPTSYRTAPPRIAPRGLMIGPLRVKQRHASRGRARGLRESGPLLAAAEPPEEPNAIVVARSALRRHLGRVARCHAEDVVGPRPGFLLRVEAHLLGRVVPRRAGHGGGVTGIAALVEESRAEVVPRHDRRVGTRILG